MQILAKWFIRGLEVAFPPTLESLRDNRMVSCVRWVGGIYEDDLGDGIIGKAKPRRYRDRLHRMTMEARWDSIT